jgi:ABC-type glycerol-3-phosphate transport system substrate-binding protein
MFSMHVNQTRTRFSLLFLFALGCATLLLSSCGGSSPTPLPPETPLTDTGSGERTLTLWHSFEDEREDTLTAMTREFHRVYPELTVTPVYVGTHDDLTKQMAAAIALGNLPDLILGERRQIAEFAAQGGLRSLDKYFEDPDVGLSEKDRTDFLRGLVRLGAFPTLDNHVYGFPFHQEAFVLFYNADMLRAMNLSRAPLTWNEFQEISAQINQEGTYGWAMRADPDTFEAMLTSRGSALLTDTEMKGLFNERAGINSMRMVSEMTQSGHARLATSDEKARSEFASGSAAFYMGWMSELDAIRRAQEQAETDFDIGVGLMPQLDPEAPWLLTRGDMFAIPNISKERARDAWFFVRWITTPSNSARWVRGTDALPLRLSALDSIAPDAAPNIFYDEVLKSFEQVPPRLAAQPAHPHSKIVEEAVSSVWLDAVQPEPDLRVILDELAARVNQILAVKP